ncbi:MAG: type II toxin-antitoxin system VapC family toxin [Gemmataceae bacterium]|nr:type II toxin-antitoxin system VapC family toxin [Gemmataceae bacterium]
MSRHVLDTDTLTLYQLGHPLVCRRCTAEAPGAVAITVISVEEELIGWYTRLRRAKDPEELARVYQRLADTASFLGQFPILSFTEEAIARYEQLKSLKLNIAKMDLRIAAITLEHGATLVTRNARDFHRVPGLALEDWAV